MNHCPQNVSPLATDFRSMRVCIKVSALFKVLGEREVALTDIRGKVCFLLYILLRCSVSLIKGG